AHALLFLSPLFFHCDSHPPPLHSFPTRRSSDLISLCRFFTLLDLNIQYLFFICLFKIFLLHLSFFLHFSCSIEAEKVKDIFRNISEEHTSELQSRFDLVCRLLLEKKKQHVSI